MNIGKEDIETLKAALKDNNESIVSDSLWAAYDMQPKLNHMEVIARRRRQNEAEEVLKKCEQEVHVPYEPLMVRKGRSGPYFQMQDVLLACGEMNREQRVIVQWLLGKANELHDAYEQERKKYMGFKEDQSVKS